MVASLTPGKHKKYSKLECPTLCGESMDHDRHASWETYFIHKQVELGI